MSVGRQIPTVEDLSERRKNLRSTLNSANHNVLSFATYSSIILKTSRWIAKSQSIQKELPSSIQNELPSSSHASLADLPSLGSHLASRSIPSDSRDNSEFDEDADSSPTVPYPKARSRRKKRQRSSNNARPTESTEEAQVNDKLSASAAEMQMNSAESTVMPVAAEAFTHMESSLQQTDSTSISNLAAEPLAGTHLIVEPDLDAVMQSSDLITTAKNQNFTLLAHEQSSQFYPQADVGSGDGVGIVEPDMNSGDGVRIVQPDMGPSRIVEPDMEIGIVEPALESNSTVEGGNIEVDIHEPYDVNMDGLRDTLQENDGQQEAVPTVSALELNPVKIAGEGYVSELEVPDDGGWNDFTPRGSAVHAARYFSDVPTKLDSRPLGAESNISAARPYSS